MYKIWLRFTLTKFGCATASIIAKTLFILIYPFWFIEKSRPYVKMVVADGKREWKVFCNNVSKEEIIKASTRKLNNLKKDS